MTTAVLPVGGVFALSLTLAAAPAAAQNGGLMGPTVQGMATTFAVGLSFSPDPNSSDPLDRVRLKGAGAQTTFPGALNNAPGYQVPTFQLEQMFPSLVARQLLALLDVDAMSTDNPIPDVNAIGVMNMTNAWAAVMFSVTDGTVGNDNSLIRRRSERPFVDNGSDIYGYYVEGSDGIAAELVGRNMLEIGSPRIRARDAGVARDIDGLDFAIGVKTQAQGTRPEILWGGITSFYFSISQASADALNLQGGLIDGTPSDGATIYRIDWVNGVWEDPVIEVLGADLGIDPTVVDVDGLSVSTPRGIFVFSTRKQGEGDNRPQFQVYKKGWGKLTSEAPSLKTTTDGPNPIIIEIDEAVELENDPSGDPDGVCVVDPEAVLNALDGRVGIAYAPPIPPGPGQGYLGISSSLSTTGAPGAPIVLHIDVNGFLPGSPYWAFFHTAYFPASTGAFGWIGGDLQVLPSDVDRLAFSVQAPAVLIGTNIGFLVWGYDTAMRLSTTCASVLNVSGG